MTPLHVVGAIMFSEGKVLACRRANHKSSPGLWEFPGGKVEAGESSAAALKREILEELGIDVAPLVTFDKSVTRVSAHLTVLLECFLVEVAKQFNVTSDDHDSFAWLELSQLRSVDWARPDLPAVMKLASMNSFEILSDHAAQLAWETGD